MLVGKAPREERLWGNGLSEISLVMIYPDSYQVYAGGFSDWRLPSREEAENFYDTELNQIDWEEEVVHIDRLFVTKCANFMWLKDINKNGEVGRINLRDGEVDFVDRNTLEHQSARLIRNIK